MAAPSINYKIQVKSRFQRKNLKAQNFSNQREGEILTTAARDAMSPITVNVSLYGTIARFGNGRHVAQIDVLLEPGAYKSHLLAQLGIPAEERGYVFINSVLCDVPGLDTESDGPLKDGDHVGIFSVDRLWPYQYRDGIRMSERLKQAMAQHGAMHHSYDVKP